MTFSAHHSKIQMAKVFGRHFAKGKTVRLKCCQVKCMYIYNLCTTRSTQYIQYMRTNVVEREGITPIALRKDIYTLRVNRARKNETNFINYVSWAKVAHSNSTKCDVINTWHIINIYLQIINLTLHTIHHCCVCVYERAQLSWQLSSEVISTCWQNERWV